MFAASTFAPSKSTTFLGVLDSPRSERRDNFRSSGKPFLFIFMLAWPLLGIATLPISLQEPSQYPCARASEFLCGRVRNSSPCVLQSFTV